MQIMSLGLEHAQATIARDPDNYDSDHKIDLAGAKWTNPDIDPSSEIETGHEAISDFIGFDANTVVLSKAAFKAVKHNPHIVERFKYTTPSSITAEMLAALWEVDDVVVGKAFTVDDDNNRSQVWGKDVVMSYSEKSPSSNKIPSYGYTYEMEGNPYVEEAYQERSIKSWVHPVTTERDPMLTSAIAGFLMQNVV